MSVNKLRTLLRPGVLIGGILIAVVASFGYGMISQQAAQAAVDCDNNAVIKCGYTDLGSLGTKIANDPHHDVVSIYQTYGFTSYNDFKARAKHVTFYKNGDVKTDDGTIVATNGASLGRQTGNGNNHTIKINGTTYYWGYNSTAFASNSIDGYGIFNPDDHSFIMGIMKSCGNPGWGNSPGYKCKMLDYTKVNDTTYNFVATPYVKNGATVAKIVYDFGDGKSTTVTSNFGQKVTHTYAAGNTYTARATVYFNVNGKVQSDTRAECTKQISVPKPKPVYACTGLISRQVSGNRTKFDFTASSKVQNGAKLMSATFIFDDNSTQTVDANGSTTVTTSHDYKKEGKHVTKVSLTFNAGTDANNPLCVVTTTTVPETCEDHPNTPECQPPKQTCENTPSLPECQKPKTCETNPEMAECKVEALPSTGPAEVAGTVLGLGSITGAGVYYHTTRRNLLDMIFKRK